MNISALIAVALLATSASQAPQPGSDGSEPTRLVQFDDLDLSEAAGRDALSRRIDLAVRRVCRDSGRVTIEHRKAIADCKSAAAKKARRDIRQALGRTGPARFASNNR